MHGSRRALAALGTAALAALAPSALRSQTEEFTQAQGYVFTEITTDPFDPFGFGFPAINDRGVVAFRGFRESDGTTGIFRGRGGGLTVIADQADGFAFIGRNSSLDNLGQVSFAAVLEDGSEVILLGSGGELLEIARTEPGHFNSFGFETFLNDAGQVAFRAELDDLDEGRSRRRQGDTAGHVAGGAQRSGGARLPRLPRGRAHGGLPRESAVVRS